MKKHSYIVPAVTVVRLRPAALLAASGGTKTVDISGDEDDGIDNEDDLLIG